MRATVVVCFVLTLFLEATTAQQTTKAPPLHTATRDAGFSLWAQLLAQANLTEAINPKARATLLAPDNRAVNAFLRRMSGMNFTELLARPQLVGLMVSYHIIPGVTITDSGKAYSTISTDEDAPSVATTGDINSILKVWTNPTSGVITFSDAQQRVAYAKDAKPAYFGAISIWGISEVLMSGAYFESMNDATIYYRPLTIFRELNARSASASGDADTPFQELDNTNQPTTQFVPIDQAWLGTVRAFATDPRPGQAQRDLSQLISYMTLAGMSSIPTGFMNSQKLKTQYRGHYLTPKLSNTQGANPFTDKPLDIPTLTIIPEVGGASRVILANIYAGKGIIHAVDNVFAPSGTPSLAKIAAGTQKADIPTPTAAKPAAQPPAKSAAQPPAKSAAQPPAKSAAQPPAKSAAQPPAKSAAQPPAKSAAQPPAKSAAQPPAKSAAQPPAKSAAQPPAKSAAQPPAKSAAKPPAKPPAKPSAAAAATVSSATQPAGPLPAQAAATTTPKPTGQPAAVAAAAPLATAPAATTELATEAPSKPGRVLLANTRLQRVTSVTQVNPAAWASTNARDALARTAVPGVPSAYTDRYGQKYAQYIECLNCKAWGVTL